MKNHRTLLVPMPEATISLSELEVNKEHQMHRDDAPDD